MSKHVVVGAGAIGSATARLLADRGEHVVVATRSGAGPQLLGVELVRCDAADASALTELTKGAAALYNCAAPAYHRWATDWPALAAAFLIAAERTGAVLATAGNLYGYGHVDAPMTEQTPLCPVGPKGQVRAQMWRDAEALHRAGRIRATEVRASDYIGPNAQSHLGDRVVPRLLAGKRTVQVLGNADAPHSWTFTQDVAELLIAVASQERAWGRPWHVPTNAPQTPREAVQGLALVAGVDQVQVNEVPAALLKLMAPFSRQVRQLPEVAYQLQRPFVLDSTAAQTVFGATPTPWQQVLTATVEHYRQQNQARMTA